MNSFWDNVAAELEYLGMTNKVLAEKVGITASNIGKGQKQGSSPSAETAVKIAKVLGVSVEYLVTGSQPSEKTSHGAENENQIPRPDRKMREIAAGKSSSFNRSCGGFWKVEKYCGSYV